MVYCRDMLSHQITERSQTCRGSAALVSDNCVMCITLQNLLSITKSIKIKTCTNYSRKTMWIYMLHITYKVMYLQGT